LSVHGTILAYWDTIFEQEESVEELASLWHLTRRRMGKIICGGGLTGSLTQRSIEWHSSEDFISHVGVVCTAANLWCIDCTVAQRLRRVPTREGLNSIVHVSIGTSNDNFELVLPLPTVVSILSVDRSSPENTLDVCRAGWIVTACARYYSRVTLEI